MVKMFFFSRLGCAEYDVIIDPKAAAAAAAAVANIIDV